MNLIRNLAILTIATISLSITASQQADPPWGWRTQAKNTPSLADLELHFINTRQSKQPITCLAVAKSSHKIKFSQEGPWGMPKIIAAGIKIGFYCDSVKDASPLKVSADGKKDLEIPFTLEQLGGKKHLQIFEDKEGQLTFSWHDGPCKQLADAERKSAGDAKSSDADQAATDLV